MRRAGWQGGSTSAEFALVLVPFLMLVFGTFEFARLGWTRHVLQETAVASARCMGVLAAACTTSGVVDDAKTRSYAHDIAGGFSVSLTTSQVTTAQNASCGGVAGFNSVSISKNFSTVIPLLSQFFASATPLVATACFPAQV